jgi:hypothetical protein
MTTAFAHVAFRAPSAADQLANDCRASVGTPITPRCDQSDQGKRLVHSLGVKCWDRFRARPRNLLLMADVVNALQDPVTRHAERGNYSGAG